MLHTSLLKYIEKYYHPELVDTLDNKYYKVTPSSRPSPYSDRLYTLVGNCSLQLGICGPYSTHKSLVFLLHRTRQ
jgi:hypothetical protein